MRGLLKGLNSRPIQPVVCCQEMPYKERKRQYAALRRAILKKNNPALTAKFSLCSDGDRYLCMHSVFVLRVAAYIHLSSSTDLDSNMQS